MFVPDYIFCIYVLFALPVDALELSDLLVERDLVMVAFHDHIDALIKVTAVEGDHSKLIAITHIYHC